MATTKANCALPQVKPPKSRGISLERVQEKILNTVACRTFSVPRGFYNDSILEAARQCGYEHVFVSGEAKGNFPFCVGRVAVKNDWTLERFKQALKGEVPATEKIGNSVKTVVKNVLGGKGYDQLRSGLLKFKGKGSRE